MGSRRASRISQVAVLVLASATCSPAAIVISGVLPEATRSAPYDFQFTASGGVAPYQFSLAEGSLLIQGLQFSSAGRLTGAPQWSGQFPLIVRVVDSSVPAQTATASFMLTVRPNGILEIDASRLVPGQVGYGYGGSLVAREGTEPYTFSLTSGSLPPGLILQPWGVVQGEPTQAGTFNFRITARDAGGLTGFKDCSITIRGPNLTISPAPLPDGRIGVPYSVTLTVTGGTAPYRFEFYPQPPPAWLSLSPQGVLSGTPTAASSYVVWIKATDALGSAAQFALNLTIKPAPGIVPATLPDGQVNQNYEQWLETVGFSGNVTVTLSSGTLPPGLSLVQRAVTGLYYTLEGNPTRAGSYTFTLRAQDQSSNTYSATYTLRILEPAQVPLQVMPTTLPPGWTSEGYSVWIASDGRVPFTITIASGSLPPGLTLSASGSLTGTPTAAGTYSFRAQARDADGRTGTRDYTLRVFSAHLTVLPATPPEASVGQDYSVTFTATGGTAPYTFTIMGLGSGLPGLVPNSSGTLSGRPNSGGTYNLRVQVVDSLGNTGTRDCVLTISGSIIVILPETLPDAQWGVPYTVQLSATGGVAPYTFMPREPWLNFNISPNGLITAMFAGTDPRTYELVVTATDSTGASGSRRYTIRYGGSAFILWPVTLPGATVNQYYGQTIFAQGAQGTVRFAVTNGALPAGLSLTPSSDRAELAGIPTTAGSYTFRITATDGRNISASLDYTVVVAGQSLSIGPAVIPDGWVQIPYAVDLTAAGGTPPYTFSLSDNSLPSGVFTLSAAGAFRGTMEALLGGYYHFRVLATDSRGLSGTKDFFLRIRDAALTVSPVELPVGAIRSPYSATLGASGGSGPYSFTLVQGTLPRGLTLQTNGILSGTPEQGGEFRIRIRVRDSSGAVGSRYYTLAIGGDSLTLGPASLPDAYFGKPYSVLLTVSGGTPPYTFAVVYGMLNGLIVGADGRVSGTPLGSEQRQSVFTVQATDANGSTGSREYRVNLLGGPLALLPENLPQGVVSERYQVWLEPAGGTPSYKFNLVSGALPPGVEFDPNGQLFGTPTKPGTYSFTIELADSAGAAARRDYQLVIDASSISLSPTSLSGGRVGAAYSAVIKASGGNAPYTFSVASGSLPDGLSLASSGQFSGTPRSQGSFGFRIKAVDSAGSSGGRDYQLVISPAGIAIYPDALPTGTTGASFSVVLNASGGAAPYQFSISSGTLPADLTLSPAGSLAGIPRQMGTYPFQVRARDSSGATGTRDYSLVVGAAGILITPASLTPATAGLAYSAAFTATGGQAPYQFSVRPDTVLPAGMWLSPEGALSGTPLNAGTYNFTVVAMDARTARGEASLVLEVRQTAIRITPDFLPAGTLAAPYSVLFVADGGSAPYVFSRSSGQFPRGLALQASGTLNGNLQDSGVFRFRVQARDRNGTTGERDYELRISPIEILPYSLGAATVGKDYHAGFSASGGTMPYSFTLSAANLPPGMLLRSEGSLDGAATAAGLYNFTIAVRDANGATGSRDYVLEVLAPGVTINSSSLPTAALGSDYFALLQASGGTEPYVYSVRTGELPRGLTLDPRGILSGTPAVSGEFRFAVEARDARDARGTREFTLPVAGEPPLAIVTTWLPRVQAGERLEVTLDAAGGKPGYAWWVLQGSLPDGVTLATSGVLSGTPAKAGQFLFTVAVRDKADQTATRALLLSVLATEDGQNTLFFDPPELSFRVPAGSTVASEPGCLAVFATKMASQVTVSLFTPPVSWASVTPTVVRTPGSICLTGRASGLPAGTYRGELRLSSYQAPLQTVAVPLVLTVTPEAPSRMRLPLSELNVSLVRGSAPVVRPVVVYNDGTGSLQFTVGASRAGWLSVLTPSGSSSAEDPGVMMLRIDPSGLTPGIYSSDVLVEAGDSRQTVRVELAVSDQADLISISTAALELVAWSGGRVAAGTAGVMNRGLATLSPEVAALSTDSPGWLKARLSAATLPAGSTAVLEISADPANLVPGRYSGRVQISAPGAANSPLFIVVGLTVLAAGSPLPPDAPQNALALTSASRQAPVVIEGPPGVSRVFTTVIYGPDAGWLTVTPAAGSLPSGGSLSLTAVADSGARPPGLYRATLAVGFSDGSVRSVPVTLLVAQPTSASAQPTLRAATSCDPSSSLLITILSPSPGFQVSTGRAVAVRAQVQTCNGTAAAVSGVSLRAGVQDVPMAPEGAGIWSGTWVARTPSEFARLEFTAAAGEPYGPAATAWVEGKVSSADAGASVESGVHSATLHSHDPVVPGAWITVFGSSLSAGPLTAEPGDFPTTLGNVEVTLGGVPLRLYFVSPGQVNAVVPWAVVPNTWQQLVLRRSGVPAVPIMVPVAANHPGIFAVAQQGTGQAAALVAGTSRLAAPGTPAARGDALELYCTGLGPVDSPPADGAPAPLSELRRVVNPVTVTVDGRPAEVLFAGLAPGTVGLYQVNIRIPTSAPAGDAVEVAITQGSATSNPVTIAVQ